MNMAGNSGVLINPTFNFTTNQNYVQGGSGAQQNGDVRPYSAARGYS